jgi:hypothetical protein
MLSDLFKAEAQRQQQQHFAWKEFKLSHGNFDKSTPSLTHTSLDHE